MNPGLCDAFTLICPSCRRQGESSALTLRALQTDCQGHVREGMLLCSSGCRYPIVAGVPVVLHDMAGWWRHSRITLTRAACADAELLAYFALLETDNPRRHDERCLHGMYMETGYGTGPSPATHPDPDPEAYWKPLLALSRRTTSGGVALNLGCGVGRYDFELARFHDRVIGLDLDFGSVAAATRIQRTARVEYDRWERGHTFGRIAFSYPAADNVFFLVADALDPPFEAERFDTVAALNLLDNVNAPLTLIGQMDALLRPRGTLVIGTPYDWNPAICERSQWLEDSETDAPALLRRILCEQGLKGMPLHYRTLEEIESLPWILHRHQRSRHWFATHLIAARKEEQTCPHPQQVNWPV